MRQSIHGEQLPVLSDTGHDAGLPYTQPVLVSIHLPGDGSEGTLPRVDSGASAPLLFVDRTCDTLL